MLKFCLVQDSAVPAITTFDLQCGFVIKSNFLLLVLLALILFKWV
jgi:hypothetical protein